MSCTSQARLAARLKSARTTGIDGVGDSVSILSSSMRFPSATNRDLYRPQDFILKTHFSGTIRVPRSIRSRDTVCITPLSHKDCHSCSIERRHLACSDGGSNFKELKVFGSLMTGIPTMPRAASSSSSDAEHSHRSEDTMCGRHLCVFRSSKSVSPLSNRSSVPTSALC